MIIKSKLLPALLLAATVLTTSGSAWAQTVGSTPPSATRYS